LEMLSQAPGMVGFLFAGDPGSNQFELDPADSEKLLNAAGLEVLAAARGALIGVTDWTTPAIEEALRSALVEGRGLKPRLAFGPVRVAITGRRVSPPLFESMELLGRDRSLARLAQAIGQ
jgi:glutamyl-tRNA synthetase